MAMRLQELHPSLVHLPITLLPASILSDLLGRLNGSTVLLEVGRRSIPIAAAGAGLAGLAGLVAQEAASVSDDARPLLVRHRNLNLGLIGATLVMAAWRTRRPRPGIPYLLTGLAGLAGLAYSAYLGGHMVYEHGVGVGSAGGLKEGGAPELTRDRAGEVLRVSRDHIRQGVRRTFRELGPAPEPGSTPARVADNAVSGFEGKGSA